MSNRTASPARRRASGPRPRRGATILLVALTLTLLLAMAGLAIDFARMYVYKAQLKTLADAAALSLATDLKRGDTEFAALALLDSISAGNPVDTAALPIAAADVQTGRWIGGEAMEARPWSRANAVRVTVRYPAKFLLGNVLPVPAPVLSESSTAVVSGYVSTACAVPIAIPSNAVAQALGRRNPNERLILTEADLERLGSLAGVALPSEMHDAAGRLAAHEFSLVSWRAAPDDPPRTVTEILDDALLGCQVGSPLSVGDTLMRAPGADARENNPWYQPSRARPDPLAELFNDTNRWTGEGGYYTYAAPPSNRLQVPIVRYLGGDGANSQYVVEYIGALTLYKLYLPTFGRDAQAARISGGTLRVDRHGGGIAFEPAFPGPALGAALVR